MVKLDLSSNNITVLDANLIVGLTKLRILKLENNQLNCSNCRLKLLKDFLNKNNNFNVSGAVCEGKLIINHNFINCKETIAEADQIYTTTDYQPSTIERTTETIAEEDQTSTTADYKSSTIERTSPTINTEVIIYTSFGSALFLIVSCNILCCIVYRRYKKTSFNTNLGLNPAEDTSNHGANVHDNVEPSQNVSTKRESGHQYEDIHELEMSDSILTSTQHKHLYNKDTSSNSSDDIELSSDDYLNTYPSSNSSDDIELSSDDYLNTYPSSNSSDDIELSSDDYLNTYQSLLPAPQPPAHMQQMSDDPDDNNACTNLYQSLTSDRVNEPHLYSKFNSEEDLEVVDEPI
ncbi:uncharacterized protein LOC143076787 [Mytilus galloprovincialis]|uniref:uncharacterized protein LOC143076787 n=1 Tax=Mytilus galloprovincialis TaxID=29158 RepID=UPI003F7BD665